jgi:type I restriction enzyme R subunit
MDSYRVEAKAALKMAMDDADATVEPVPPGVGGGNGELDIDKLSAIIKTFNDLFGNIPWKDEDKIRKVIAEEIPIRVSQDKAYQNAQANSDRENARLEHDKALNRVVLELLSDHTELFKQFSDNSNFKRWLTDMVFDSTYLVRVGKTTNGLEQLRTRAVQLVKGHFGDSDIWSRAVNAVFEAISGESKNGVSAFDLIDVSEKADVSAQSVLLPVLNLLAADDVGILRRELHNEHGEVSIDEIRRAAKADAETNMPDRWLNQISVRWSVSEQSGDDRAS